MSRLGARGLMQPAGRRTETGRGGIGRREEHLSEAQPQPDEAPRWGAVLLPLGLSLLAILIGAVALFVAARASTEAALDPILVAMDTDELEREKLRQEILNLKRQRSPSTWVPVALTIGVPAVGLVVTLWKQVEERKQQRLENQREHQATLDQQRQESLRRFDEQFASIVSNLGSDRAAMQASSALSLLAFLKPDYAEFSSQIFLVLAANLRVEHPKEVNNMLVWVFERAIRQQLASERHEDRELALELPRMHIDRIDLSGLDLTGVDIGFTSLRGANLRETKLFRARGFEVVLEKARLSKANLNEARLRGARGKEAHFHDANLVSARLEEADLSKAEFQRARMQSAHLEGATLKGAKFEEANVNDTFFAGAVFDRAALHSLSGAKEWRHAHLDDRVRATLARYSEQATRAAQAEPQGTE